MSDYFRRSLLENHVLVALFVALLVFALYEVRQVIVVVFISYILMAAISPLVDFLISKGARRWLAVFVSYLVVLVVLILVILPLVPFFINQVGGLLHNLPFYFERTGIALGLNTEELDVVSVVRSEMDVIGKNVVNVTNKAFSGVFSAIAILVLPLYFLLDKNRLQGGISRLFGKDKSEYTQKILIKIDQRLGEWSRGQAVLSFSIGIATWLVLTILGIPFALPLALLAGILEVVPTIGPFVSAIPAVIVAMTISSSHVVFTIVAYILIQLLENNLLVPKIMEKAVGLNPVVVIVGVMTGAQLMGIMGALLAVPFILVVSVIASGDGRMNA